MKINTFSGLEDFQEGTVLIIDKPLGWTSFDVVKKVRSSLRHTFKIKKIKVGHAGTLDPLATGVLVVCTGRMTKQIEQFMSQSKTYTGTIVLGETRPTYDAETEVDAVFPTEHITEEKLEVCRQSFEGEIEQLPPIYSAKKVDGKVAYKQARLGKKIELKTVMVTIHRLEIDPADFPIVRFEVACSKGTYIRSLAYDFGKALGSGAYLGSLRRTKSGEFSVEEALNLDDLITKISHLKAP
jgi:tRNA pseudouridine55 synthase